jgi:hypothetical protein
MGSTRPSHHVEVTTLREDIHIMVGKSDGKRPLQGLGTVVRTLLKHVLKKYKKF